MTHHIKPNIRPKLVEFAIERVRKELDPSAVSDDFVIIGDTPKDIHCGHSNNVAAVGVATGIYKSSALATVADAGMLFEYRTSLIEHLTLVLENFSNVEECLETFRKTKFGGKRKSYDVEAMTSQADP